jgi:DNA-directed RNA polymerase subunit RPC12/RpoP
MKITDFPFSCFFGFHKYKFIGTKIYNLDSKYVRPIKCKCGKKRLYKVNFSDKKYSYTRLGEIFFVKTEKEVWIK